MKYVTVGGVPEHFNLPWHLMIDELNSGNSMVTIDWRDYPGGTGDLCTAIKTDEIEIAIALTEGVVKQIEEGAPLEIIDFFISSPLNWGVHVASDSVFKNMADLAGARAAISRIGSGSDLMTKVLAENNGWSGEIPAVIVGNMEGGKNALLQGSADYFMWEKYTTKPLVDSGELNRIGECQTPWPCFVIVTTSVFRAENEELIEAILNLVREKCLWVKTDPEAIQLLATQYNLKPEDVSEWREQTEWMGKTWNHSIHTEIVDQLKKFGILKSK